MHVTCEFYATVRDAVGTKRLHREVAEEATVRDILIELDVEYDGLTPLLFDGDGRIRPNINVLVNDTPIRDRDGPDTQLADGDTLMIVPSVAGGR